MKTIEVFDPALCCSSGVCGVDVDQQLVIFSADVDWARQSGLHVERFNLAQQPMAFAENAVVRGLLARAGQAALPITLVDGELAFAGRYPSREDLARWADVRVTAPIDQAKPVATGCASASLEPAKAADSCCSGGNCC